MYNYGLMDPLDVFLTFRTKDTEHCINNKAKVRAFKLNWLALCPKWHPKQVHYRYSFTLLTAWIAT